MAKVAVRVGTNLEYAAIHEFGGVIRAKGGGKLTFEVEPGVWRSVRQVTIPARPYLRPALDEHGAAAIRIAGEVTGAAIEAAWAGRRDR